MLKDEVEGFSLGTDAVSPIHLGIRCAISGASLGNMHALSLADLDNHDAYPEQTLILKSHRSALRAGMSSQEGSNAGSVGTRAEDCTVVSVGGRV
eukprot:2827651-Rhodomonas_salina.1